ncbi:MAG: NAD(P)H-hydrate dehydratase [Lachnospiraceae bacterium]
MRYLPDNQEMKLWESAAMELYGLLPMNLMEQAAGAVVKVLENGMYDLRQVLIVCGSGNNGGDGLAIARILSGKGIRTEVYFVGNESRMTEETALQMEMYRQTGGNFVTKPSYDEYTVIVDAVFGIGCNRDLQGAVLEYVRQVNAVKIPVIAVDIPSGVNGSTGKICTDAVKASTTVTFSEKKLGMMIHPAKDYCGEVICADIGIPKQDVFRAHAFYYEEEDLGRIPKRIENSHKGSYGKVLVVAGSAEIFGAAYFSSAAAYRTGSGLVKVFTPEENRVPMQTLLPEALLAVYDRKHPDLEKLRKCMEWADVIAVGPGIGIDDSAENILQSVLKESKVPIVIDADGINLLAKNTEILSEISVPVILTPHLQEMSRLTGMEKSELAASPFEQGKAFTDRYPVILVWKDARTIVMSKNRDLFVNTSGNPGMATGGSGDVLTGVIASLIGQGMEPLEAARLGVYLHGKAGDAAAVRKGMHGMLASDILYGISEVIKHEEI